MARSTPPTPAAVYTRLLGYADLVKIAADILWEGGSALVDPTALATYNRRTVDAARRAGLPEGGELEILSASPGPLLPSERAAIMTGYLDNAGKSETLDNPFTWDLHSVRKDILRFAAVQSPFGLDVTISRVNALIKEGRCLLCWVLASKDPTEDEEFEAAMERFSKARDDVRDMLELTSAAAVPSNSIDHTAFVPAKSCRNDRIITHKQLISLLAKVPDTEQGIRRRRSGQRLYIHAGDWHRYNEKLDREGEVADDRAAKAIERESGRKTKTQRNTK
jgi:hypothetical protein